MHLRSMAIFPLLKGWHKRASFSMMVGIGIAVAGGAFTRILGSVTQVLLARLMGPVSFGVYTTLYALLGPVIVLSSLGLDTWLLRQGGNLQTLNDNISKVFSLRLLMAALLIPAGSVIVLTRNEAGITPLIVMMASISLTCDLLLMTGYTALRAQVRNWASALLQASVAVLLITFILLFWNSDIPVLAATSFRVSAGLLGVAALIWLLRQHLHISWQVPHMLDILKQTRVFLLSDVLAHITLSADLFLISFMLGALAAGVYGPALTIINATFLVPRILWQALLPIIAQKQHTPRKVSLMVGLGLLASIGYGLFCASMFYWQAEWIIHKLFGEEYHNAVLLIQIMSLITLMKSINFGSVTLMVAYDRQVLRTKLQAIAAVVNVVGNLICIPMFGLLGAAWVNVATETTLLIGYGSGAWYTMLHREST